MHYLLITHIPFARAQNGNALLDRLWYEDLLGLAASMRGTADVTVAAPCVDAASLRAWGTTLAETDAGTPLNFLPLPAHGGRLDLLYPAKLHRALRPAVASADLVHTSNLFGNDTALYFAHDLATKLGRKTLFVVAEDFFDMLGWEWVRTAPSTLQRWRRERTLRLLDRAVRKRIGNSSLVFLHTPAAVRRYRLDAANAFAIRQPVHEAADVIPAEELTARNTALQDGAVLRIATASRMQPLKGLDMLLRSVALLRDRDVAVELTMYGGGPQQAELERLTGTLGITDRVRFGGALAPGAELRGELNRHHLFAMPHLTTDFGRGFFDAIAAALPVVAFRSAASEDTVRDGVDGLLVPNADVEALASVLERLHKDRYGLAAMARSARERALRNTRSEWNRLRAMWIADLFPTESK